jgi:hypothetical protein
MRRRVSAGACRREPPSPPGVLPVVGDYGAAVVGHRTPLGEPAVDSAGAPQPPAAMPNWHLRPTRSHPAVKVTLVMQTFDRPLALLLALLSTLCRRARRGAPVGAGGQQVPSGVLRSLLPLCPELHAPSTRPPGSDAGRERRCHQRLLEPANSMTNRFKPRGAVAIPHGGCAAGGRRHGGAHGGSGLRCRRVGGRKRGAGALPSPRPQRLGGRRQRRWRGRGQPILPAGAPSHQRVLDHLWPRPPSLQPAT